MRRFTPPTDTLRSAGNLRRITLSSDNVFRDGFSSQLPTMSGSVRAGYTADLTVGLTR